MWVLVAVLWTLLAMVALALLYGYGKRERRSAQPRAGEDGYPSERAG